MSKELDCDKLRILTSKLKCLSHFIETQDPDRAHPVDFDDVQFGLSLFINEIVSEMVAISKSLEKNLI